MYLADALSRRISKSPRVLTLCVLLLVASCDGGGQPVAFDTGGGDAWTFDKLIEGTAERSCDAVVVLTTGIAMTAQRDGERFTARVPLSEGDNTVSAECRQGGLPRGKTASQQWHVRLRDVPVAHVRALVRSTTVTLDGGATTRSPAKAAPIVSYEWRAREDNPAPLPNLPASGKRISFAAPEVPGEYYVTLRVTDAAGRTDESTTMFRLRGGKAVAVDLARDHPAWLDSAVVYGIAPFFFGSHGFDDVASHLDDLADLGVTVLWLSPVTAAARDDYGYAVVDHFRLRSDFGDEASFRRLISEAHARGMRVIADFVTNHLSDRHPYYVDADARGRASPYYDFFARTADSGAANYFDWRNLKNLNFDNPEVQRMMIEASVHWIRNFDIDGFRVDAAWGPRRRAPEFWQRWRAELKRVKPDLFLLAEATAQNTYYFENGFDAAYDWNDQLGHWGWQAAFDDPAHTAELLREAITDDPQPGRVLRFIANNDTGQRFITRYGLDRTRVAAAMLLTLPGIPALFMGDEVGAEFEPYGERVPIDWRDPHNLRPWYQRLLELRRELGGLRGQTVRWIDGEDADVLAYVRPGSGRDGDLVILLNYGQQPATVHVPADLLRNAGGRLTDQIDCSVAVVASDQTLKLPAYGARVLRAGDRCIGPDRISGAGPDGQEG
jgi:glycosidase